jgi:hypothetical protein
MRPKKDTKVTEIFEDSNQISKRAIFVSLVVFFLTLLVLRLYIISFDINKFFVWDGPSIQFFTNSLLSVVTSFVAAVIFAYTFRVIDNKKLAKLRSLAQNEYLIELLQTLNRYKGAYVEDYIASVKICRHKNDHLLFARIRFEYKKYPINNPTVITIYRLTADSDDPKNLQLIAQERLIKEFVWQQDERTMPGQIEPKTDYTIEDLYIGQHRCKVDRIDDEDKITFTCNLPHGVDLSGPQPVEYQVKLPFERESVLALTHDFPTLNATVNFDYREAGDVIDAYVLTMAGIQDNPLPRNTDDPFVMRYKYRGWLSPQNGYVFVWWKKQ